MLLLEPVSPVLHRVAALHQQEIATAGAHLPTTPHQLIGQPGPFCRDPGLHLFGPSGIGHQPFTGGGGQAIDGPRIAPLAPVLQTLGLSNGVTKAQPSDSKQLGEAANHHQARVLASQLN